MASITTRAGKGAPLTNAELDANFTNINSELATAAITGGTINGATVGAVAPSTGAFTQLDVDNVRIDANTVSTTNTNGNLEITPNGTGGVNVNSTAAVKLPAGTTAQRPTPAAGMFRFNGDNNEFEGYDGTAWGSIGGGSEISDDTTTATELYPVFVDATTGAASNVYISDGKLGFTPSTGELAASQLVASNGIVVNSATVSASYTIPIGSNAVSGGPVSVAGGVTVTVSAGSVWTVV
jgi:hypothetical protein